MSFQNLCFSNHLKHTLHLELKTSLAAKEKITESKSQAGEVTITKVIENSNAPTKKTWSLRLSLKEVYHINSINILSDESIDLVQKLFR